MTPKVKATSTRSSVCQKFRIVFCVGNFRLFPCFFIYPFYIYVILIISSEFYIYSLFLFRIEARRGERLLHVMKVFEFVDSPEWATFRPGMISRYGVR